MTATLVASLMTMHGTIVVVYVTVQTLRMAP